MNCKQCNIPLSDNAKFCTNCGCIIENKVERAPQPQEPAAQPAQVQQPAAQPEKKKGGFGAVSVLCCVFICIFSLCAFSLFTVRTALSEDSIYSFVENEEADAIFELPFVDSALNGRVTVDEAKEIYEEGTFKDYIKDVASEYAEYIRGGDEPSGIRGDDVVELLQENESLIYQISGYRISSYNYKDIQESLDDDGAETLGILYVEDGMSAPFKTLRLICSDIVFYALIVLILILIALVVFLRKSYKALKWVGIPLLITSALFTLTSIGYYIFAAISANSDNTILSIITAYLPATFLKVLLVSIVTLIVSILLLVVTSIIKKAKK